MVLRGIWLTLRILVKVVATLIFLAFLFFTHIGLGLLGFALVYWVLERLQGGKKECPQCATRVLKRAKICPRCHYAFDGSPPVAHIHFHDNRQVIIMEADRAIMREADQAHQDYLRRRRASITQGP